MQAWPDGRDAATESTDLMVAVTAVDDLREIVAEAATIAPVGSRTHWEVGGPPPAGDATRRDRRPAMRRRMAPRNCMTRRGHPAEPLPFPP